MRAIPAALALLILATTPGLSQTGSSGDYYLPLCRSMIGGTNERLGPLCLGFAQAARTYTRDLPPARRACVPVTTSDPEVVQAIVQYLERNPKRLNDNFGLLVNEALSETWPCR